MFTGIIEGLGTIKNIRPDSTGKRLTIMADFSLESSGIGDSIAVNGACLTAVTISRNTFEADVSPETITKTTFGKIMVGNRVNLERALRLSDRIDGHLVSGHIDGIGKISGMTPQGNAVILTVNVPDHLARYMIEKGSVAVDGISLTINQCGSDFFKVSIIPHTLKETTLNDIKIGKQVNIETDMIGKYVERFVNHSAAGQPSSNIKTTSVTMDLLRKSGFA